MRVRTASRLAASGLGLTLVGVVALGAGPASAQDGIGALAETCMLVDGEVDTLRAGICLSDETEAWEARLALAEVGLTALDLPERVEGVDFLTLSRAFEEYRDTACDAAGALWPGMLGAGVAWAECRLQVTARHTLRMEAWLEALQ